MEDLELEDNFDETDVELEGVELSEGTADGFDSLDGACVFREESAFVLQIVLFEVSLDGTFTTASDVRPIFTTIQLDWKDFQGRTG